jgi:hypothetical protein
MTIRIMALTGYLETPSKARISSAVNNFTPWRAWCSRSVFLPVLLNSGPKRIRASRSSVS